jgi:hypothetical protein
MSTTYNSKPSHVDVIQYTPFEPRTGVASNVDAVASLCGLGNVEYAGGNLNVADSGVATDDWVGKTGTNVPVRKTPGQIETQFTED